MHTKSMDQQAFLPRVEGRPLQGSLFLFTPEEVCGELSLSADAAGELYANGWLSFDPRFVSAMDEAQEAELRFLGSLWAVGCDDRVLRNVLEGLRRPYSYSHGDIYYCWPRRKWQSLPRIPEDRADVLSEWLAELVGDEDLDGLISVLKQVTDSLEELTCTSNR